MNGSLTKKPREKDTQDGEGGKQIAEGREMRKMLRVGRELQWLAEKMEFLKANERRDPTPFKILQYRRLS